MDHKHIHNAFVGITFCSNGGKLMKKPQQIIFLNGPPHSGKDTAAVFIYEVIEHARMAKLSACLKDSVRVLFGLPIHQMLYLDHCDNKDQPRPEFRGMSWREVLIWLAEDTKARFGQDFFGVRLARKLAEATGCEITAISDSGFKVEAEPIIEQFGAENCHLWHIHRPGCSFYGDSRGYWTHKKLEPVFIDNRHDLAMYKVQVVSRVNRILGIKKEVGL